MEKAKKAQLPIRKIIGICLILLFIMGVGVMASNAKLNNVKIILSNGYIMNVTTSKTKISEILDENHIILLPEESVIPDEDSELSDNNTIKSSNTFTGLGTNKGLEVRDTLYQITIIAIKVNTVYKYFFMDAP